MTIYCRPGRDTSLSPTTIASLDVPHGTLAEATPFPNARPPVTLKAEIFGPDGWIAAVATIESRGPEWIETELATGATLPVGGLDAWVTRA
jgi:hypothetical protein